MTFMTYSRKTGKLLEPKCFLQDVDRVGEIGYIKF